MPSLCQDVTSAGLLARQEQSAGVVRRVERPGVMLSSDFDSDLCSKYWDKAVSDY